MTSNLLRHGAIVFIPKLQQSLLTLPRSTGWPALRRKHLKKQPFCQACGKKIELAVHHIIPVHIDKTKELDPKNLITLCENSKSTFCHFTFGHLGISWMKYDPNIIADAATHLKAIQGALPA